MPQVRDLSAARWLGFAAWLFGMLGLLGGTDAPAKHLRAALAILGGVGWLVAFLRWRWRPAEGDPLAGATTRQVTYDARGGGIVLLRRSGRARRVEWQNADEMASALIASGSTPEAQRFELGTISFLGAALASVGLVVGYGWCFIGVLPRYVPAAAEWPWMPLIAFGAFPPAFGIFWLFTTSAELTRDALRLRVGLRTRVVPRGAVREIALTEGAIVVRADGATIRVLANAEGPARRLVRALAAG